ncbi:unnamed protein product [Gongylonema pulchrum]|uniref:Secreted protein n=1 Tax=Gongylonema pulchrum TaxID=637853 RepID=A0A183DV04_9BILA|nr:unnamed protein product [Gongylonema pulchrum]
MLVKFRRILLDVSVWHYVYYTIEFNETVKKPEERRDMAHIHWLKKHFPFLRQYDHMTEIHSAATQRTSLT